MNWTKGKWEVIADFDGKKNIVRARSGFVAYTKVARCVGECEANARLIAAAVNACASVNPDNPIAVAESTKAMYEALKVTVDWLVEMEAHIPLSGVLLSKITKALAEADNESV